MNRYKTLCAFAVLYSVFFVRAMDNDERDRILARTELNTTEDVSRLRLSLEHLGTDLAESFGHVTGGHDDVFFSDDVSRHTDDALGAVRDLHTCVRERLSLCSEHRDADPVLLGVRAVLTDSHARLTGLQQELERAGRSGGIQALAHQDATFNNLNTLLGIFSGQPYVLPEGVEHALPCEADDLVANLTRSVLGRFTPDSSLIDIPQPRRTGPEAVAHAVQRASDVADEVGMRTAIVTRDVRPVLAALSKRICVDEPDGPVQPSSVESIMQTLQRVCTVLHDVGTHFGEDGAIDQISSEGLLFLLSPPRALRQAESIVAATVDEDAGFMRRSSGRIGRWLLERTAGQEAIGRLAEALEARPDRPSATVRAVQEFIQRYELGPVAGMVTALLRDQPERVNENLQRVLTSIVERTDDLAQANETLGQWRQALAEYRARQPEEQPYLRCFRHWAAVWNDPRAFGRLSVVSDEVIEEQVAAIDWRRLEVTPVFSRHIGFIQTGPFVPFDSENGFNCAMGACDHKEHCAGLTGFGSLFSDDGAGSSGVGSSSSSSGISKQALVQRLSAIAAHLQADDGGGGSSGDDDDDLHA